MLLACMQTLTSYILSIKLVGQASTSLALPDPFRAAAYRFEIISAALQGSGTIDNIYLRTGGIY